MASAATILLVDDNEDDVFLMRRALGEARIVNPLFVVQDGEEAIAYLGGSGRFSDRTSYPLPALVLLDLKLPLRSGHDVLSWIRQQRGLESVVVVTLTSSNLDTDSSKSYRLGTNSYLVKPPTPEKLKALAKAFNWRWVQYA